MLEVALFPGLPGGRWARLRELSGEVELSMEPNDPCGFVTLVDLLLVNSEGTTVGPGRAFDLCVSDLDRIAVAFYRRTYGERVEGHLPCRGCHKPFEVSFSIAPPRVPEGSVLAGGEPVFGPDESGCFELKDGTRFRLPNARDQWAVRKLTPDMARDVLLRRCLDQRNDSADADLVEEAMEAVGPLLADNLVLHCPHCEFQNKNVPFSIQRHLLESLSYERRFLYSEVHSLARAYRWSYRELISMPTRDRRTYVAMVLADRSTGF